MILHPQVPAIRNLMLNAALTQITVGYTALSSLFPAGTLFTDQMDTLEDAIKQLAHPSSAIYSAVMAKNGTGIPGAGFFDLINNMKAQYVFSVAGHNNHQALSSSHQQIIAAQERACVYAHAQANYGLGGGQQ